MEPDNFDFLDDQKQIPSLSQIVITESASTCALNSIAASPIGTIDLNTQRINQFFNVTYLDLTSSALARHFSLFEQKLGSNVHLQSIVKF